MSEKPQIRFGDLGNLPPMDRKPIVVKWTWHPKENE